MYWFPLIFKLRQKRKLKVRNHKINLSIPNSHCLRKSLKIWNFPTIVKMISSVLIKFYTKKIFKIYSFTFNFRIIDFFALTAIFITSWICRSQPNQCLRYTNFRVKGMFLKLVWPHANCILIEFTFERCIFQKSINN